MRIIYIGKFSRIWDEEGIARSFETIGHRVERYDESRLDINTVRNIISSRPDIILYTKLKCLGSAREYLIEEAKSHDIKTVCWVPDLYFGLSRQVLVDTKDVIFRSDYVFTPDGGNANKWKKKEINHQLLRQGIYHEFCYKGKSEKLKFDICFVGSDNPEFRNRFDTMAFLQSEYKNRFAWLGQNNTNHYRGGDLNELYASTIVIGDSVYSPNYWSNRIYETLGRGGFLIHPMIEGLEKEYEPYTHFIPYAYKDFDGLKEKIDYYFRHEKEREKIAFAALEYTKQHHTLLNRCKRFLELIK